jgi:hypothetical protein
MKNIQLIVVLAMLGSLSSCYKYTQPSEPKLSGRWRIDKIIYLRVDGSDTAKAQYYFPGDLYVSPEDAPLDSINVGFTEFAMDYSQIYFGSQPTFAGNIIWKEKYIYTVSEVNFEFPGFMKFETAEKQFVWKILFSEKENAIIQLKGEWEQNSIGFYGVQTATNYDDTRIYITRVGP